MAKIKIIFLSVCCLIGLSWDNNNRSDLAALKGTEIVKIARTQLSVRELTGKNDGLAVEKYLRYTNLTKGNPWCAAFVSWVYHQVGFKAPKTAWSPALFPKDKCTKIVNPGYIYGLYSPKLKRVIHCGIAERTSNDWILGIEGNTNNAGSVDGNGVYLKRRHSLTIHVVSDWILERGGQMRINYIALFCILILISCGLKKSNLSSNLSETRTSQSSKTIDQSSKQHSVLSINRFLESDSSETVSFVEIVPLKEFIFSEQGGFKGEAASIKIYSGEKILKRAAGIGITKSLSAKTGVKSAEASTEVKNRNVAKTRTNWKLVPLGFITVALCIVLVYVFWKLRRLSNTLICI